MSTTGSLSSAGQVNDIHPYIEAAQPGQAVRTRKHSVQHSSSMLGLLHSLETALPRDASGRVLLFASARPGEGKTAVLAEFAAMLAKNPEGRVAVIDAGARRKLSRQPGPWPQIPIERLIAGLRGTPGAARAGIQSACVFATIKEDSPESAALLDEADVWARLKTAFNHVLVEMPSLADSPLALATARHCTGVVLVIESGRTRWPVVQHAQQQFARCGATVLGAFLNKRIYHVPKSLYNRL